MSSSWSSKWSTISIWLIPIFYTFLYWLTCFRHSFTNKTKFIHNLISTLSASTALDILSLFIYLICIEKSIIDTIINCFFTIIMGKSIVVLALVYRGRHSHQLIEKPFSQSRFPLTTLINSPLLRATDKMIIASISNESEKQWEREREKE